jgi:SAM-dependent methyltransferase
MRPGERGAAGIFVGVNATGVTSGFSDEQRLAFGRAAELYDEMRPGYPTAVIDRLMSTAGLADGNLVYEVGAGTGKGTVELARRGLEVLAIEPDPDMVRVARGHCSPFPAVSLLETSYEQWKPTEPRSALISFQAWHWTRPELRYRIAHRAVSPGGTLAGIWSFPDWDRCPLRPRLTAAYQNAAPDMLPDFPMHPASDPTLLAGDWQNETTQAGLFDNPAIWQFEWSQHYSSADYRRLLQTHQDHMLLDTQQQSRLLAAIGGAIDIDGETIDLPLTSYLCTATRSAET